MLIMYEHRFGKYYYKYCENERNSQSGTMPPDISHTGRACRVGPVAYEFKSLWRITKLLVTGGTIVSVVQWNRWTIDS